MSKVEGQKEIIPLKNPFLEPKIRPERPIQPTVFKGLFYNFSPKEWQIETAPLSSRHITCLGTGRFGCWIRPAGQDCQSLVK